MARTKKSKVKTLPSTARDGMVLTDLSGKPLAMDAGAASILNSEAGSPIPKEILELVRSSKPGDAVPREAHFRRGTLEYVCRACLAEPQNGALDQAVAVLHLERCGAASDDIHKVAAQYGLTDREEEALRGVSLGLTGREISERMNVTPNTVRAFLRLVMMKMDASTQTGLLAKIMKGNPGPG